MDSGFLFNAKGSWHWPLHRQEGDDTVQAVVKIGLSNPDVRIVDDLGDSRGEATKVTRVELDVP